MQAACVDRAWQNTCTYILRLVTARWPAGDYSHQRALAGVSLETGLVASLFGAYGLAYVWAQIAYGLLPSH